MGRKSVSQKEAEKEIAKYDINYADNSRIADRAKEHVIDMVRNAKIGRKAKEEEWLEDLRLWAAQLSDGQMYQGRSNLIIPELHNQVETSVGKFQQGLFPNDDYIGVVPMGSTTREEANNIKEAVFHELDHKNNLPAIMERYQRQKVLYGTAFLKATYEDKKKHIFVKNSKGYVESKEVPQFQGVRVEACDVFRVYAYPENISELSQAQVVFEESFITKRVLEDTGVYKNLDDANEVGSSMMDFQWVESARMSMNNLSNAYALRGKAVLVTECFTDFDIVKGEFVPCIITLANMGTVIRVQRNPYWHQLAPFMMGRYIKGPAGELYGHSLAERLRSLQYMMTDLGNQTMDSLTYTLNPIALIDPGFAGDINSFKLQPGARWFASPQGVQFANFPDISSAGLQGMQQVRSMIQQFSDNAPQMAPQLSGKARNATQVVAVQNEMGANVKNMIRSDEHDVLGPLCYMTHMLLRQYQEDEYQISAQGPEKGQWITKSINPNILHRDAEFVWRGSSVEEKTAVRSQQLMNAFNLALQVGAMMPDAINLPKLFKIVMEESFNLKDLQVFNEDEQKYTVDAKIENLALMAGQDVKVNHGDEFELHMEEHEKGYQEAEDDDVKLAFIKHMQKHRLQKQAKDIIQAQQAKMQALKMAMQGGEGEAGLEGVGQDMGVPGMEGNMRQQSNPATPAQAMQGVRATEPNMRKGVRG